MCYGINDAYLKNTSMPTLAAFMTIDGYLYVIKYQKVTSNKVALPDTLQKYPTP